MRPTYALRNARVLVREDRFGEIALEYKAKPLQYTVYHRQARQAEEIPSKTPPKKLQKSKTIGDGAPLHARKRC